MKPIIASLNHCEGNPLVTSGFRNKGPVVCANVFFVVSLTTYQNTIELSVIQGATTLMWRHNNLMQKIYFS